MRPPSGREMPGIFADGRRTLRAAAHLRRHSRRLLPSIWNRGTTPVGRSSRREIATVSNATTCITCPPVSLCGKDREYDRPDKPKSSLSTIIPYRPLATKPAVPQEPGRFGAQKPMIPKLFSRNDLRVAALWTAGTRHVFFSRYAARPAHTQPVIRRSCAFGHCSDGPLSLQRRL
jgi:hypothetical protein